MKKKSHPVPVSVRVYAKRECSRSASFRGPTIKTKFSYQSYLVPHSTVILSDWKELAARINNATSMKGAAEADAAAKSSKVREFWPKNADAWLETGRIDPDGKDLSVTSSVVLVKTGFGGLIPFEYWNRNDQDIDNYALGFVMIDGNLFAAKYRPVGKTAAGNDEIRHVRSNGQSVFDTDRWVYEYMLDLTPVELPVIDGKKARSLKKEYVAEDGSKIVWAPEASAWIPKPADGERASADKEAESVRKRKNVET